MSLTARSLAAGIVAIAAGLLSLNTAAAQSDVGGCEVKESGGLKILRCPGGLTITEEKGGARFTVSDRDEDGEVDRVTLRRRAILIDVPKVKGATGFEVVTPQAIAAVRGTRWAVEVQDGKTSVFVVRGSVGVRRGGSGGEVVLGAGDGVDVEAGSGPLTVKHWPEERVEALMARFGQ